MTETEAALLVVDDDDNRFTLVQRLKREGYGNIAVARDGRDALARLAECPFDLVLLDVMVPGLGGFGVLSEMKAHPALRHVPVVMISAVNDLDRVVRCIELGAEDYLPKPFNKVLLRARVGACPEKKRLRDQERRHVSRIERQRGRLAELLLGLGFDRAFQGLLGPRCEAGPETVTLAQRRMDRRSIGRRGPKVRAASNVTNSSEPGQSSTA